MGDLRRDQHTFYITSCSFLSKMKNVSDKSCREIQKKFYVQKHFKYHAIFWAGHRWQYGACVLCAGYQTIQVHPQNI